MVFSEPLFLFWFLPLVLFVVHVLLHPNLKSAGLFVFSLLFYAFGEVQYAFLILVSILVNFGIARAIDTQTQRKLWLAAGIIVNVALLGWFKYAGFIYENVRELLIAWDVSPPYFKTPGLPLGISFFTFQGISYLIDVYRRETTPADNPLRFGLFISFFPQLIAGPIVRYNDVEKTLDAPFYDASLFVEGTKRFITGLAKKVILANHFGIVADYVYNQPGKFIGMEAAWIGIIAYAFQLYFDFSGYSSMAIGIGKMFGFNFPENFNYPYISQSVTEYWRRWHITLGSWFRDYVYIPMGGSRGTAVQTAFNLWFIFVLVGFWHGDAWNFILFGVIHGVIMVLERAFLGSLLEKLPRLFRHVYFIAFTLLAYVVFRTPVIADSWLILKTMFGFRHVELNVVYVGSYYTLEYAIYTVAALYFALPPTARWIETGIKTFFLNKNSVPSERLYKLLSFMVYAFLLWWAAVELAASTYNPFIYYRF